MGNTKEDTGYKKENDEFAFKHFEFEVQIRAAIQGAVCISYEELKKNSKLEL